MTFARFFRVVWEKESIPVAGAVCGRRAGG